MLEFNFDPFPVLETPRLRLRQHRIDDLQSLYELRSSEAVRAATHREMQPMKQVRELLKAIIQNVEQNRAIVWGMELRGVSGLIGNIGFWRIKPDHHRAETGYLLFPQFWGQGLMTEAMTATLNYGFETMGLHSVEASVAPDNIGSTRVLEKCGFVREALFREDYRFGDRFLDTAVYGLLKSEWGERSQFG